MPRTIPITERFEWDPNAIRYRRLTTGKFVSGRAVKLAIRRVIRNTQAEMKAITDQMVKGEITLKEWQSRFSFELKNLHVSSAMAGGGGQASMTQLDYLAVGRNLKFQYGRLERFAQQIERGEVAANAIDARVNMYIASGNGTYEGARRDKAVAAGFDEERNVLGARENHCTSKERAGCVEQTRLGWVPLGMLVPVGQRQCLAGCGCSLKFRKRPLRIV